MSNTGFGVVLDAGADLDADGTRDLAAGLPFISGPIFLQGQVRVFSGVDGSLVRTLWGLSANSFAGLSVILPGDMNGDGGSEVVAGTITGSTLVFGSAPGGPLLSTISPPATWPCSEWLVFGSFQLDGDGIPDLLFGCPNGSPPTGVGAGGIAVVSGASGLPLAVWEGAGPFDRFGWRAAVVDDLDGNGIPDVVAGAPSFGNIDVTNEFGFSYAQTLSSTGGPIATVLPGVPACPSSCVNTRFGWSVSGGGDIDGDGTPDIVVGESVGPLPGPGLAVYSGATGALLYETFDRDGWVVRFLGDVDGDGFGDYLGCDPTQVTVVAGLPRYGVGTVYSGSNGSVLAQLTRQGSAGLGGGAAAIGDIDGDDFPDVVLGDDFWFGGILPIRGRVTAFSLAPVGVDVFGDGCPSASGQVPRLGARGSPTTGSTVQIHISGAPPGAVAVLFVGLSDANAGSVPLPMDLTPVGLPGCWLLTSGEFAFPATTQATAPAPGRASFSFAIPPSPALIGAQAFVQWFVGAGGGQVLPASMTRGARLTVS
ncbi:MAG TPA: hypothetical protein VFI25_12620 [Planctomycetota bacterium]|nr:hypothetical protein [Planctomycetota bacterium]